MRTCSKFHKTDPTGVFSGLRSTRLENFRSRCTAMRLHAPPEDSAIISVFSLVVTCRRRPLTRFHALDAPSADTCPMRMTSWMTSSPLPGLTRLTQFDPNRPGNLTRSEPPQKKKKKKRVKEKKNALTKWTLDLDQKVKIFKTDLSHSIFRVHSDFGSRFFIRSSEIA